MEEFQSQQLLMHGSLDGTLARQSEFITNTKQLDTAIHMVSITSQSEHTEESFQAITRSATN